MRYLSLFSGIGGFDLALDRAGCQCAGQVECDPHCLTVLRRHWPHTPKFDDVCTLHRKLIHGTVDLICGGFPCQDLSVAGKRAGLAGERSGLFYEFMRIAAEFAPRWLLLENVPGLLSSNGGRDMGIITTALAECGYGWAYRVLDAQYFGVAQRRRRVFIVGCLGDTARAAQILFEPGCLRGDSAPRREMGTIIAALTANGVGAGGGADDNAAQAGHLVFEPRYVRNGRGAPDVIAPPLKAQNGLTGKGDGAPVIAWTERGRAAGQRVEWQENLMYSLNNPGAGGRSQERRIAMASGVRRLMPVECERLQGFPDDFTEGQSDAQRYRQLGNAVCVPVAEWIARRLMETDTFTIVPYGTSSTRKTGITAGPFQFLTGHGQDMPEIA